jgi:hypothetical protein
LSFCTTLRLHRIFGLYVRSNQMAYISTIACVSNYVYLSIVCIVYIYYIHNIYRPIIYIRYQDQGLQLGIGRCIMLLKPSQELLELFRLQGKFARKHRKLRTYRLIFSYIRHTDLFLNFPFFFNCLRLIVFQSFTLAWKLYLYWDTLHI